MKSDANKKYSPIIVALDAFADEAAVMRFVDQLDPDCCELKVGKNLFTKLGPDLVRELIQKGLTNDAIKGLKISLNFIGLICLS